MKQFKPLLIYISIAYLVTWTIAFGILGLFKAGLITNNQLNILHSLGALGPFIAAVIASSIFYGRNGRHILWKSLSFSKLNRQGLLLAFSPLIIFIIAIFIYPVWTGKWFSFKNTIQQFDLNNTSSYIAWIVPFIFYGIFEEFGWRGFALPHLQQRFSALLSTFFLTCIWALWHFPFFFYRFKFSGGMMAGFFFGMFVGAIILTSIFNTTSGCTTAAIIFHITNNLASTFDKNKIVVILSIGFMIIAAFILLKYKTNNLASGERIKNNFMNKREVVMDSEVFKDNIF